MSRAERRSPARRLPIGAEVVPEGVHFRVWAPARSTVEVPVESEGAGLFPLAREPAGWFSALVSALRSGEDPRFAVHGLRAASPSRSSGARRWVYRIEGSRDLRGTRFGIGVDGHTGSFASAEVFDAELRSLLRTAG